jgi:hypothetical protein
LSEDPTRETAAGFDIHPPFAYAVLDDIDDTSATAKTGGKTAMTLFRYGFDPLGEPESIRPKDDALVGFDAITKGNLPDLKQ